MSETLAVSEIFGPTIQGEGRSTGRRAMFLRLATCNLHCWWCDTPYTWDWSRYNPKDEIHKRALADVAAELNALAAGLLVVTGGEPLIQRTTLGALEDRLSPMDIEIETNGTMLPLVGTRRPIRYNVSPKLAHAGDPEAARIKPDILRAFVAEDAAFKFVVETAKDLDDVAELCGLVGMSMSGVWLMPQARTVEELDKALPGLAGLALRYGCNVSDRLHLRIWGNTRGH